MNKHMQKPGNFRSLVNYLQLHRKRAESMGLMDKLSSPRMTLTRARALLFGAKKGSSRSRREYD